METEKIGITPIFFVFQRDQKKGKVSLKMCIAKYCFSLYNRDIGTENVRDCSLTIKSRKATQFRMKHTEVAL